MSDEQMSTPWWNKNNCMYLFSLHLVSLISIVDLNDKYYDYY